MQDILPRSLLLEWFWVSVPLLEAPWLGFKPQTESPVFTAVPYYCFFSISPIGTCTLGQIKGIKRKGGKKAESQ